MDQATTETVDIVGRNRNQLILIVDWVQVAAVTGETIMMYPTQQMHLSGITERAKEDLSHLQQDALSNQGTEHLVQDPSMAVWRQTEKRCPQVPFHADPCDHLGARQDGT